MRLEIARQPQALRDLAAAYARGDGFSALDSLPPRAPVITGMGASLHAAQICAAHMLSLGLPAVAVEAAELLYYGRALLAERPLVFVSQSGTSPEIAPLLALLPPEHAVLAVTNSPESPLARGATALLPIGAAPEQGVATRTYVNTLALLWLLARAWAGGRRADDADTLARIADRCEALVAGAAAAEERWMQALGSAGTLLFLGHGPHAATARQAAMMLAERARVGAIGTSVGALRHGPVEIVEPGVGAVVFAAPGPSYESACALAAELGGHGARVLLVEYGRSRAPDEAPPPGEPADEFLAPILDVIPAQIFADALARSRGIAAEFRYLGKGERQV